MLDPPDELRRTSLLATLALALVCAGDVACTQDRAPDGSVAAGVGQGPGAGGVTGNASGGVGGTDGGGGLGPVPEIEDCACLAAAASPECRVCLDDAPVDGCADEAAACDAVEPGYCALVIDCAALCPTPDARCMDVCLGAEGEARDAAEGFVACACTACSNACGDGGC